MFRHRTPIALAGVAAAGALLFAACSDHAPTAPTPLALGGHAPDFDASSPPALQTQRLIVCKDTPQGTTGTFEIDASITNPDGTSGGSLFINITAGECKTMVTSLPDPTIEVGEVLQNSDPGWQLASVTRITTDGGTEQLTGVGTPDSPVSCVIGGDKGCILIFHNTPTQPPPPPGKTFSIGPSSMEGAILISNGDWVNGGYSFKFVSGNHTATNFFVHATVSITGPCIGGGPASDTFTFSLNDATYAVPAGNTDWLPTGDANDVRSWEGSVRAQGVCGGVGKLDARHGAVFTATVSQNPPSGSLVDFRFKYRDPAAKGKPNTNCLDTSDPNRARADVCGASWSQTVRDP